MGIIHEKLAEVRKEPRGHWLMKSEPSVYSIHDLQKEKKTLWDGIRNYQARNIMKDDMRLKDYVLFYHSSTKIPGVAGIATVSKEATTDPEQFNPKSHYYDKDSNRDDPTWVCVEIKFREAFPQIVRLEDIKKNPALDEMILIQKGMRLSIQPVIQEEFNYICKMAGIDIN